MVLAALVLGGMYVVGNYVSEQDYLPVVISVDGQGRVFASPDIAQISFGVETGRQKTAEGAMDVLSEKMNAIVAAVKAQGVEEKDIATESFYLSPAYDWNEGERIDRGFEARQSLTVKVRALGSVGDIVSAVTSAGANQVGGVSFTIDDPEELRAQARAKAVEQAKDKAEVMAQSLGMQLGKLKGFNEGYGGYVENYRKMDMATAEGMGGAGPVSPPMPAGEEEISVTVSLSYELK